MSEIDKIQEEIVSKIKSVHEKNDALEKKYDGLVDNEIKKLKEQICDAVEKSNKVEALEKSHKESEENLKSLEATLLRSKGVADDESADSVRKFKGSLARYARKAGKSIDSDILNSYYLARVKSIAPHADEEDIASLVKTLSVDSNPDGGYWIIPERISTRVTRDFESSPVREVATVMTTISDQVELIIDDDEAQSGGWVAEQQPRNETETPQIGLLSIPTHEQFAEPLATQKFLDDASIDVESWLSAKVDDILRRTENTAFVKGNGAAKPKGFLDYPAWAAAGVYERGALERVNSGKSGEFQADTIKALKNSLHEIYQPNAVFMTKRASFLDIITLKDGTGQYLLNRDSMKEGDTQILLGKRVIFADDLDDIAADADALVYGDFAKGYTIVDRMGIRVLRDPFTSKPFVKFYTTKRVGGAVTNYESIKIQPLTV